MIPIRSSSLQSFKATSPSTNRLSRQKHCFLCFLTYPTEVSLFYPLILHVKGPCPIKSLNSRLYHITLNRNTYTLKTVVYCELSTGPDVFDTVFYDIPMSCIHAPMFGETALRWEILRIHGRGQTSK